MTVSAVHFKSDSLLDATTQGLLDFLARSHLGNDPSAGELEHLSTKAFQTYFRSIFGSVMGSILFFFTEDQEYTDKCTQKRKAKCTMIYRETI